MQIASLGDSLHEMSKLFSVKNKETSLCRQLELPREW